ncbi:hypothetical protein VNO77_42106 [Canavalia gladiata]|uniref:Dehydrogenase E1 component domain-containing protein n=1 Tax=Canavalia gladiata TaxID=3824 RepID=A0AAN9K106_CANGL
MQNNIQDLTYRVRHHSTSNDSIKCRLIDEIEHWKMSRNPMNRFRRWVERNGWWSDKDELELRSNIKKQLTVEKAHKPPLEDMFNDVYHQLPSNLQEWTWKKNCLLVGASQLFAYVVINMREFDFLYNYVINLNSLNQLRDALLLWEGNDPYE